MVQLQRHLRPAALRSASLRLRGRVAGHRHPSRPEWAANEATAVEAHRHEDGVLEVRLVGPARRNALGRSTIERIESLITVPPLGTRVIVLTAEAPDFCAGYDLREAAQGAAAELIANGANFAALQRSAVPVIAVLHGNVIGGGLELALAADVRLAAPDTRLAIPAGRLGLVYSEEGVRLLVDEVGESRARAMLLAGRALTAKEAESAGIVSEVVELDHLLERAFELASSVASWSAVATSGNRRVLDAVVGRRREDVEALRLASFQPGGALAKSIERFVSGEAGSRATWRASKSADHLGWVGLARAATRSAAGFVGHAARSTRVRLRHRPFSPGH